MEDDPLSGGILAGECGSGKTVISLLMILLDHERLKAAGSEEHFTTLILAPSAVIDVWYNDYIKYFKGALNCRIFYGRPDQEDEERAKCSVGGRVEDLDEELSKLDPKNPEVCLAP
ncbi:hypothetical protein ACMFMF_011679 [Clarireedia jacksonii]